MKTCQGFFVDNMYICRRKSYGRCARPFFACGNCGNSGNTDNQRVKSEIGCGNFVAICGNGGDSVAKVVAIVAIFIYNVSIRKLI